MLWQVSPSFTFKGVPALADKEQLAEDGNEVEEQPARGGGATGPRWPLIVAWIGVLGAIAGIADMLIRLMMLDTQGQYGFPRQTNASDWMLPGLVWLLVGVVLAAIGIRRRLKG